MECFLLCENYIGGVEMTLTLHNGDLNKLVRDTSQDSINFMVGGQKIISLESTGDIYVKGKLVENDKEVVDGMRELLNGNNSKGDSEKFRCALLRIRDLYGNPMNPQEGCIIAREAKMIARSALDKE
ncbi:hypothetical protein BTT_64980 (plasmid) [Bacillus thuringiensis serovar morrisoni str. 4AA1]|nr:hypothetical protein [Bacillus thuringiensis]MED3100946.1 hypothetical protein [Bacillus thuringiensis]MEE2014323.1 hypothetical protein [Bacillus thuringiensis]UOC00092.1 hypothetical protein BTT_12670 [Bacillus thuringiensis serovar morrisoni str. 4AA1]UOC05245.1 hypothetical protein BTT_64980 [Bacillus thuringiensis serovar morrisoni str. 4AA1]